MERDYKQDHLVGPEIERLVENYNEGYSNYYDIYQNLLYTRGTHIRSILKGDMFRDYSHSEVLESIKGIVTDIEFDILKKPMLTINHKKGIQFILGAIYLSSYRYILISITYDSVKKMLEKFDNKIDIFRNLIDTNFYISKSNNELGLTHSLIVYKDFFLYCDLIYDILVNIRDSIDESMLKSIASGIDVEQKIVGIINEKSPYRIVGDYTAVKTQHMLDTKELVELFSNHNYKIGDIIYTWRFGEDIIYSERNDRGTIKRNELKITSENFDIPENYFDLKNNIERLKDKFDCRIFNPKAIISNIVDDWIEVYDIEKESELRKIPIESKEGLFSNIKRFFTKNIAEDNDNKPEMKYFGDNMFSLLPYMSKGSNAFEYTPRIFMKLPEKFKNGYNIYIGYVDSDNFHKEEINGLVYSNRSGYYPSIDDVLVQDQILGEYVNTRNLDKKYKSEYKRDYNPIKIAKDSIVNLYLDIDLDLIHKYMMKVVEMTNIGYWEIKVKKSEVVMISDKYRPIDGNKRLMYILGDVRPVYLDDRKEFECSEYFNKEDRAILRSISDTIRKNFKIDHSKDEYLDGYYV